ncbi:MAG TPA: caspase family protein [Blastocatellia bacterium]|jgi:hypothetical protein|nr:caspase family protein [Blastocatellia bacterium]
MSGAFLNGYAVVIGVGADLPVTIEDARAITDELLNPSRGAYPPDQVRLLTGEGARQEHIIGALNWLTESAGEDDIAIVYYSGHGLEVPEFLLVPYGFDKDDVEGTAVSGEAFTELLRNVRTQKLLVLLDCCHAGGQAEAKNASKSPMPPSVMNELRSSSGRVVIASSRKDESSWTGNPYSQFTMAILEALAGYGAFEQDGFARVLDLALYVGRVVPERTDDKQHPIIKVSNLEDNFAIAWYAGGDKNPKPLSWRPSMLMADPVSSDGQVSTWVSMLSNYRTNLLLIE